MKSVPVGRCWAEVARCGPALISVDTSIRVRFTGYSRFSILGRVANFLRRFSGSGATRMSIRASVTGDFE
jgi:hypothetical protein